MLLRRFYDKIMSKAHQPQSLWFMYFVAFTESFIFPIPPDLFIIPITLARPKDAYRIALFNTFFSVIGGLIGYGIGYWSVDFAQRLIDYYGFQQAYHAFTTNFERWGFWIIVLKGLTPIPFKLVTIASGLCQLNLGLFIAASVIARGSRFFLLGFLLKRFGPAAKNLIDQYLPWIFWSILLALVLGICALKFI